MHKQQKKKKRTFLNLKVSFSTRHKINDQVRNRAAQILLISMQETKIVPIHYWGKLGSHHSQRHCIYVSVTLIFFFFFIFVLLLLEVGMVTYI